MAGALDAARLVAFVATSDLARARAFYEEGLGLVLEEVTPFALAFRSGGTLLRATLVEDRAPAPYTVLGWAVDDVDRTVTELAGRGIPFNRYPAMDQDELGIWHSPHGARVAWFSDPDGNVLSVTQYPPVSPD
jgi:catechol 2,3-dioxygenase-like lactoylglutathione lyase family enzyme